jgi:carbamoyltransferase
MVILGITHVQQYNTSAVLLIDGELVAWSEEERHIREKHAAYVFPMNAIRHCLNKAGITIKDVDHMATTFSYPHDISKYRTTKKYAEYVGLDYVDWYGHYPDMVSHNEGILNNTLNGIYQTFGIENEIRFPLNKMDRWNHHLCHAVSTVIPSGFEYTNYMTSDGDGGEDAGQFGYFDGNFNKLGYMHPVGSLGAYFGEVTRYLGFRFHSGEGKTMGLACYGEVNEDLLPPLFMENKDGFLQPQTNEMVNWLHNDHAKIENKIRQDVWCKEAKDLAATAQSYFERIMYHNLHRLQELNPSNNLCLAGGSFLNCTSNGKIAREVDNIYIQPASHDSGTALGAAILSHHKYTNEWPEIRMNHAYYGSDFTEKEVETQLKENDLTYEKVDVETTLPDLINENLIVGYFQGKAEVGPRALCHRSILANPIYSENLDRVNKIKKREWWRPLAPTIAEEYLFEITDSKHLSPFMLMACQVKEKWRDRIPAVVHVDNSCRPQTVNENQNPIIHKALLNFREMTLKKTGEGIPVFLNTSFNIGEPLVDSPSDAIKTFLKSDIDVLLIEGFCVRKDNN